MCFALLIVPEFLPHRSSGGSATMEGALGATYGQGLAFLLLCGCALLWLLGLALAATKQD